jgi:replication factor C large subunit
MPYRVSEMQEEWTEKYRPKSLSDVMGNDYAVRSLRSWAESWSKGAPRHKAMVLRGEPGTGKTSSALALARDFGWDVVEMNASDHRNADSIKRVAGLGSISQTLTLDGDFRSTAQGKRKLIVLDEADNLFGREDYGGAKAIVEVIRESSQPVILIVNDYYELTRKASALKTLADKAIFRRLDKRTVVAVLSRVAKAEGVTLAQVSLEKVAENAGGDLRAAVNDLQMLVEGRSEVTEEQTSVLSERNQESQLGDSLKAMFGAKGAKEAQDATKDLDKLPDELEKWVEESIPSEMKDPRDLADAFDALSRADIYLRRSRKLQHYGMWAYARTMMTGGVALSRRHGARPYVDEYRFPSHFMVMSRAKGANASRESLRAKLSPQFHTSGKEFKEAVLPPLRTLARRERGILVKLAVDAELDDGDVAYLLGSEPGSAEVEAVMAEVRAAKGDEDSGRAVRAKPRSRSKGLGDF